MVTLTCSHLRKGLDDVQLETVAQVCVSVWEAEARGSQVQILFGFLWSEFKVTLGDLGRLFLNINK